MAARSKKVKEQEETQMDCQEQVTKKQILDALGLIKDTCLDNLGSGGKCKVECPLNLRGKCMVTENIPGAWLINEGDKFKALI